MSGLWARLQSRHSDWWAAGGWLELATGFAAATPIIAATVRAVADHWYPLGDDANIATRSYDVLTVHSPLVGHFSQTSGLVGQPLYDPGPLAYWLLALPAHFGGPTAMLVVIGAINVASVMGAVAIARRRGGTALMIATAIAIPLMLASLPVVAYRDIWVQAAALMPFTLLIFLTWSVALGEHRLLPLTVLVISFVTQCHLAYVLPSLGLLLVGLAGLVLTRRHVAGPRGVGRQGNGLGLAGDRRSAWHWIVAAIIVGLLCWTPPLVEQATHRPGNLVLIGRAGLTKKPKLGPAVGWHAVVRAFGVPPWWLREFQLPDDRVGDLGATLSRGAPVPPAPGGGSAVSAMLVLGALVVALVVAARRRRHVLVAAAALALVLIAALFAVVASTPSRRLAISLGYTTWWGAPAGMWVWLITGWLVASLVELGRRLSAWRQRTSRRLVVSISPALAAALSLGGVAAVGGVAAAGAGPDPLRSLYRPLRAMATRLESSVPRGRTVLVESGPSFTATDIEAAVIYALRHQGLSVVTPELLVPLGQSYGAHGKRYGYVVRVEEGGSSSPPAGGQVIARVRLGKAEDKSLLISRLSARQGIVSVLGAPATATRVGR